MTEFPTALGGKDIVQNTNVYKKYAKRPVNRAKTKVKPRQLKTLFCMLDTPMILTIV